MKRPLPNTYWVVDGRLLAGEHPGGASEGDTRKRLERLISAGIDSFIDLTESHERDPYRGLLPREVDYYQRPLPDHDVPSDPNAINEVLAVLRKALGQGRRVYVHCRAGIGRTGMTIACHLRERDGLDGELALTRLNKLWQQNARAKRWPRVPETAAQADFVRNWIAPTGFHDAPSAMTADVRAPAPLPTATTSSRLPALSSQAVHATLHVGARLDREERARGALLGLAVADALSVPLHEAERGAAVPTELTGGGPEELPPGAWTDETAMVLCQADSLLACQGVDTRDQADRYLRWLREGHRSATGEAVGVRPELVRLLGLAAARHSALTGIHDPRVLDAEPLARCAPAAIFYGDDLEAAAEAGADAARITHQAPVLVDACRLFTALIHTALAGADRPTVLAHALQWDGVLRPEVIAVAEGWTGASAATPARRPRGAILAMLDGVVRAFAQAKDFRSGLLALLAQPVAHGEPDVAAAAYGQLAGAWFGEQGLPASWLERLIGADEIADVAEALAAARSPLVEESSPTVPQGVQSR